ncbi:MAG: ADP-ribosylglycohydrolase family protein [Elusimicrobiales bacterium]|nr:ADP-ribosylglycohydrolase family protein [Elusimicrobiales bacterium]
MLGAIAGDIIGSVYENFHTKRKDFRLFTPLSSFTDDTVLTVAVAEAILSGKPYGESIRSYARSYPLRGYGGGFMRWALIPGSAPYNSFGNGSAMRVSPVAWAFEKEEEMLAQAEFSAACTHNHPEGIKGAQAAALAVFLARKGAAKEEIKTSIASRYGYDLSRKLDEIRPSYKTEISCQASVPEAIIAFLEAENFEDAVRNAVSLGGDADTQAAIAGSIAEAYYKGIPAEILQRVNKKLPAGFLDVIARFRAKFRAAA